MPVQMQRRYPHQPHLIVFPKPPFSAAFSVFGAEFPSVHILIKGAVLMEILQKVVRGMSLIVQKYGGSSVKDSQRLYHVARRIAEQFRLGNQMVVVLSAQGKTTDSLIEKAQEITDKASGREMDVLLSTGEQLSVSLMAMALGQLGCKAVSLCGWQVGIHTNGTHQNARILQVDTERIRKHLEQGMIVLVAGFQGISEEGDITTLGRGGSDTTAVALAAALKADRCQIFTDVEGVYTADPRLVSEAVKWQEISYNDMLVMASMGAKVLHDRSVELARDRQVCLEVLSSLSNAPGTLVRYQRETQPLLRGITADNSTLCYRLENITLEDAGRLMMTLYRRDVRPDLTEQPALLQLFFTVPEHDRQTVNETLSELSLSAEVDESRSKVTLIGSGLHSIPNLKQELNTALQNENIPLGSAWLGERRYSVLVPREQSTEAIEALHRVLLRYQS